MQTSGESHSEQIDPLDEAAEELLRRCRCGETPDIEELARRFPELADRIRALFPTLLALERDRTGDISPPPGPAVGAATTRPTAFGPFEIIRTIGQGGMGIVYEAIESPLGRRVALKILPPESLSRPTYRERFEREARVAARLHHTNIVPVFASGEHDGTLFFVMQFIDGRSVAEALGELGGTRPSGHPQAMARLALQAAEGLAYAHAQGVLHRDLKPANLLLDAQGTLWIADFGLAKAGDVDDLTASGELVGTLRYLAPERFAGRCDARSDVYALGATLYEMLALRPAFDAKDRLAVVDQIKRGAPPLRLLAPEVPLDLETVVHKALAAAPEQGYASAQELADDLRRFLADLPVKARRAGPAERIGRWARRNPVLAALAFVVAVVALVSTVLAVKLDTALAESERHLGEVRQSKEDMADLLWRSQVDQARTNRRSGRLGHRVESLRLLDEAARRRATPELRDEVIACLALIDLEEVSRVPGALVGAAVVEVAPALRPYVAVSNSAEVRLHQLSDGREVARVPSVLGRIDVPFLSRPRGRFLLLLQQKPTRAELWDLDGPEPRLAWRRDFPQRIDVFDATDDGRVVLGLKDGSFHVSGPGELMQVLPAVIGKQDIALHPNRPWLAVGRGKSACVMDLQTGQEVTRLDCPTEVQGLDWDYEGHLVVGERTNRLWAYDVAARRVVRTLEDRRVGGIEVRCHPSLPLVVSSDWSNNSGVWDLASGRLALAAPRGLRLLTAWGSGPDALLCGTRGEDLVVYRLPRRVLRLFACHTAAGPQEPGTTVLDPHGRWLAAYTAAGLALFDLQSPSGTPVALADNLIHFPVGFEQSGRLISNSPRALVCWPASDGPAGTQRLGPPVVWLRFPGGEGGSCSASGAVVAVGQLDKGAVVVHRDKPGQPLSLRHSDVRRTAVSPDGRWVATGNWDRFPTEAGVKVWDAATGRHVTDLPLPVGHSLAFSPEGRWLAAADTTTVHLYRTGDWQEERTFRGDGVALGPDGLLALDAGEAIRLVDAETGGELCRLEAPYTTQPAAHCFSADGSLLVATDTPSATILAWDLRVLRQELAARGLDWDHRPFPPPGPKPAPLRITIDPGAADGAAPLGSDIKK